MGTPGVPLGYTKVEIVECIKKRKGIITHIAKELGCTFQCIYEHLNDDPELWKEVEKARASKDEEVVDVYEYGLQYIANLYKEKPTTALRAIMYGLDNKGKKRGYDKRNNSQENDEKLGNSFDQFNANMAKAKTKNEPTE